MPGNIFDYNRSFRSNVAKLPQPAQVCVVPEPDACPVCRIAAGTYTADSLPALPIRRCHNRVCECWYALLPAAPLDTRPADENCALASRANAC
jgi:hypothetical protein